jgi:hypothetical protein
MLTLLTLLAVTSVANADIRPLLRRQGFDAPLNGREKVTYVGHIPQARNDFQIYLYHGVYRASAVDHGVNRLIVVRNGSTYFGDYNIEFTTTACKVRGHKVICRSDDPRYPSVIAFTKRGPPLKIWFNGEVLDFAFGNSAQR